MSQDILCIWEFGKQQPQRLLRCCVLATGLGCCRKCGPWSVTDGLALWQQLGGPLAPTGQLHKAESAALAGKRKAGFQHLQPNPTSGEPSSCSCTSASCPCIVKGQPQRRGHAAAMAQIFLLCFPSLADMLGQAGNSLLVLPFRRSSLASNLAPTEVGRVGHAPWAL